MEITDNKVTLGVSKMEFNTPEAEKPIKKEGYKIVTDVEYNKIVDEYIDDVMNNKK